MKEKITETEAIDIARKLFTSPEIDAHAKARAAYAKARDAYAKARDACAATIKGYKIVFVHNENRAFNIAAEGYDGVYCFVLNRRELWRYPGEECPDPNTVEKIEWRAK